MMTCKLILEIHELLLIALVVLHSILAALGLRWDLYFLQLQTVTDEMLKRLISV